jgi:hypothetical protein
MWASFNRHFLFLFILLGVAGGFGSQASAQDDPNGQYVTIVSATLNGETREVVAPIEPTILRLFFVVQTQGEIKWEILSPLGKPAALDGGNVSVTEAGNKRTIAMWDPRPGRWSVKLTGKGAFTVQVLTQSEVYACCLNVVGRQVQPLEKIQTPQGSQLQAYAYVSGNNIEALSFQLVNEQGEIIAPVKFRQSDYSNPQNFFVVIEVPAQPARLMVRGREQSGGAFQRVYPQLFVPQIATASPAPATVPLNPVVTQAAESPSVPALVTGEYRIVRAQVLSYNDEPLLSANGNPLGIRMQYSVRFPVDGYFAPQPNLYPERITSGYTGALSMRVVRSTVTPQPEGVLQPNQVLFAGRTVYQREQVYQFTVDLVPNYVVFNEQKQQYCLATKGFSQAGMRERFEREITSEQGLRYRFSISGTGYDGRQPVLTEKTYIPSLWWTSLQKEGVTECQ